MDNTVIKPKSSVKKRLFIAVIVVVCIVMVIFLLPEIIGHILCDHVRPITVGNFGFMASFGRKYDYRCGDILIINTQSDPRIGDLVFYNAQTNDSFCMTFGSGITIAKIIGLPGDTVKFYETSYEIRGINYPSENRYYIGDELITFPKILRNVKWGDEIYNLARKTLTVPEGQYLTDMWIGHECIPGVYINGSTAMADRYTIKQEAIIGIVLMQIGHSRIFENYQKSIVY